MSMHCAACGMRINVGERLLWDAEFDRVYCSDSCAAKGAPREWVQVLLGLVLVVALCLIVSFAFGEPPAGVDLNSPIAKWFQSLTAPDGTLCCSISDCRPADIRQTEEGYEAFIDKREFPAVLESLWVKIPPEKILQRTENPVGRAVVCYTPALGVLCFVREPEA